MAKRKTGYAKKTNDERKAQQKRLTDTISEVQEAILFEEAALEEFLRFASKLYRYSAGNQALIYSRMPTATHCLSYSGWKKLGRRVKAGEKGIEILAPNGTYSIEVKKDGTKDGKNGAADAGSGKDSADTEADTEKLTLLRFRVDYTFDISQTEGEAIPELLNMSEDPLVETADELKATVVQAFPEVLPELAVVTTEAEIITTLCRNRIKARYSGISTPQEEICAALIVANWLQLDTKDFNTRLVTRFASGQTEKALGAFLG